VSRSDFDLSPEFDLRHVTDKDETVTVREREKAFAELQTIGTDAATWLAVNGALMLALRHPGFTGATRDVVAQFAEELTDGLVAWGCLTEAEATDMWRQETAIQDGNAAEEAGTPLIVAPGEIVCLRCGCTDRKPCANGCHWTQIDREAGVGVCSNCA